MLEEFISHLPDWAMVIITLVYAITTIAICVANYRSTKVAKEQLAEERRASKESEEYYCKSLAQQKTDSRIAQMPYFYLSDAVTFGVRDGRLTLRIYLENCGNGSAVQIRLVTKDDSGITWPVVYKNEFDIPYLQTDTVSRNFARIDSTIEFEITRYVADADTSFADGVTFEIEFQDMFGNTYRQAFWFDYRWWGDAAIPCGELGFYYSNKPQLNDEIPRN